MTAPAPDLRSRVLEAARRDAAPVRDVTQRRNAIALVLAFLPVVGFETFSLRLGDRPLGFVVVNVAGWALLAAAATFGTVARGRSMLGRPRAWLLFVALALPILLFGVAALGYVPWPSAMDVDCPPISDFHCCEVTLLLAIAPLAAFAYARRGTDPVHPQLTGAALGASAGGWAAVAMALHCPITSMRHVVLGHIVPVIVFALIGLVVGAKVVSVRAR
jgi:hypothetical protein